MSNLEERYVLILDYMYVGEFDYTTMNLKYTRDITEAMMFSTVKAAWDYLDTHSIDPDYYAVIGVLDYFKNQLSEMFGCSSDAVVIDTKKEYFPGYSFDMEKAFHPGLCCTFGGRGNGKTARYDTLMMVADLIATENQFLRRNGGQPEIKDVIFNDPATIVFWEDGTKTIVKCQKGDKYDPEKGLAMAYVKKLNGNKYEYYNEVKHWLKKAPKKGGKK